jgi:hypothetical protein
MVFDTGEDPRSDPGNSVERDVSVLDAENWTRDAEELSC